MNYVGREPAPAGVLLVGDTNPVGLIGWFHGVPDASYLALNGQTVLKATYPDLWAYAQSFLTADQTVNPGLYRNVDANNFALPKLDGLFIRAQGQVDASHVAAALGVKQADVVNPAAKGTQGGGFVASPGGTAFFGTTGGATYEQCGTGSAGCGTETRPVNVALVPCVKALKTALLPNAAFDLPGRLLQSQAHIRTDSVAFAGAIPYDDTIPQIGEGAQLLTVNITPQKVGSRLRVRTKCYVAPATAIGYIGAIFQGAGPDALVAQGANFIAADTEGPIIALETDVIAASLATLTFSVRAGGASSAGNIQLNGRAVGRRLGGAYASWLRVDEFSQ